MGVYFPNSFREWASDMRVGLVSALEFGKGAFIDTPKELYHFIPDVFRYVIWGVDSHLGEGRQLTLWQMLKGYHSSYDWADPNPLSNNNPVLGWVNRSIDVVNTMFYGGLDLLSGHNLNTLFNDELGWGIKYFTPAPTDARGMGRDVGMAAVIAVTPALKARAGKTLGIEAKPKSASESTAFRQYLETEQSRRAARPKWSPAFGMLGIWPNVEMAVRWFEDWLARFNSSMMTRHRDKVFAEFKQISADDIAMLKKEAGNNPKVLGLLNELAHFKLEAAEEAMKQVQNEHRVFVLAEMSRLALEGSEAAWERLLTLIENGEEKAIKPLTRAAARHPGAVLCLWVAGMEGVKLSPMVRQQASKVSVIKLAEMARINQPKAVLRLRDLYQLGNQAARSAMVSLDVAKLIEDIKTNELGVDTLDALAELAKVGNLKAMVAIEQMASDGNRYAAWIWEDITRGGTMH